MNYNESFFISPPNHGLIQIVHSFVLFELSECSLCRMWERHGFKIIKYEDRGYLVVQSVSDDEDNSRWRLRRHTQSTTFV